MTNNLLNNLELPTISDKDKDNLKQPISDGEINQAIKGMKSGKGPGKVPLFQS